jgi:hypothetical protein
LESWILHYQKHRDLATLQGKSVLLSSHYSSADKVTILVNLNDLIIKLKDKLKKIYILQTSNSEDMWQSSYIEMLSQFTTYCG